MSVYAYVKSVFRMVLMKVIEFSFTTREPIMQLVIVGMLNRLLKLFANYIIKENKKLIL